MYIVGLHLQQGAPAYVGSDNAYPHNSCSHPWLVRLRPLNTRVLLCHPITLCRLTTEYSLNASVQTSVDDVSRVDKKVGCHSKVCGIDAASIFSLYFWCTAIFFRILRIVTFFISPY